MQTYARFLLLRNTTKHYKITETKITSHPRTLHLLMPTPLTPRRPPRGLVSCLALWLIALLWAPAGPAAASRIVEQAFVLDPGGQMTLEQAQQQPATAYTGKLRRVRDRSVVWVRLRVAPSADAPLPATEHLRVVALWSQSLALYDPLRRDANAGLARLDTPPAVALFTVHMLPLALSTQARDVWLRLEPSGPIYLKAALLTPAEAASREVSDGILQGMVIGAQAVLILLGVIAWMADRTGIGHTMFTKQIVNLMLTLLNSDLFALPVLPGVLHWHEGIVSYAMEGLRLLNLAVSLWFFIKVLELLQASTWARKLQGALLTLLAVGALLLLSGQLALARSLQLTLYMAVPLALVVVSLTCPQAPRDAGTCIGRSLGWARRGAQHLAFGVVLWTAWVTSFTGGFYRTQDISFFAWAGPTAAFSAVGVLLVVSLRRIRADRQRQLEYRHRAELNALALDFERNERQRQQEFMAMLTHELKAPLSTLGIVIGSPTPSASMRRHADLALASMRQVIDHCAQSADIDDDRSPPQQLPCALAVELQLRIDACADKARIRLATSHTLPTVLADRRMLTVILNNLLDNALKYSPPNSAISAALMREIHPQGAIQKLIVSNPVLAGPLPDATRLFSKYYRGDAAQRISGSGLGLHLSRLLARRQGGDLTYQANALGVTFTLVLPESPLTAAVPA